MIRSVAILLLLCAPLSAAELQGVATRIIDGDTLEVTLLDGDEVKVRLWGVDAPESDRPGWWKAQPYSAVAKAMLAEKCLNRQVVVTTKGQSWGRVVGPVRTVDGNVDVGAELVREGLAWWSHKYAPREKLLSDYQDKAKLEKRGMWADKPTPPWEWRK